jgi:putative oxidoreductase
MNAILAAHRQLSRLDATLGDWGASLASLALRWYIGWQFFKAGLTKIRDWDATLALFQDEYHVPLLPPELAAYMAAGGELILPLLLFAGVITRPAALALFCVNAMAVISYPQLFSFECPAAINDHFFWGAGLLLLVAYGPGRFSVDAFLNGKRA